MTQAAAGTSDDAISSATPEARRLLTVADLPPEIVTELHDYCGLDDQQINDILEAVHGGVKTVGEFFGVTPEVANTFESMALGFYRRQFYVEATCIYQFLIELFPRRSTAWRGLGACNQAIRCYPMAIMCYQNALQSDPLDIVALIFLGECFCYLGHLERGLHTLEQAVQYGPRKPWHKTYIKRAEAIIRAHKAAAALPLPKEGALTAVQPTALPIDASPAVLSENVTAGKKAVEGR